MVKVDTAAPATTLRIGGAAPVGAYGQPAVVSLAGADGGGSGIAGTEYRLDGGAWTAYTAPFTVTALGCTAWSTARSTRRQPGGDQAGRVQPGRAADGRVGRRGPAATRRRSRPWAALGDGAPSQST